MTVSGSNIKAETTGNSENRSTNSAAAIRILPGNGNLSVQNSTLEAITRGSASSNGDNRSFGVLADKNVSLNGVIINASALGNKASGGLVDATGISATGGPVTFKGEISRIAALSANGTATPIIAPAVVNTNRSQCTTNNGTPVDC